jgi:putative ABC transport system substrate-binding protein
VRRRRFLVVAAALLAPPASAGAQGGKVLQLGILSSVLPRSSIFYQALEQRLRELGYEEGRNLVIHFRSAEGRAERLPPFAAELAGLNLDVVVAGGPEAPLRAARDALGRTPIVMVAIDYDPVARGYVASLARPGGTITGVFIRQIELTRKRLELLREAIPGLGRVAVLWDAFSADQLREVETTARALALPLLPLEVRAPGRELERAVTTAARGAEALLILASPRFYREHALLLEAATRVRLPTMASQGEWAEAGALMTYGANYAEAYRRAAGYVDRIFRGDRPADLPVDLPTRFELFLNAGTARTLGLTFPPALAVRADRIIP